MTEDKARKAAALVAEIDEANTMHDGITILHNKAKRGDEDALARLSQSAHDLVDRYVSSIREKLNTL